MKDLALTDIKIRPAEPDDHAEVARIWWESWRTVGIVIAQDATISELHEMIPQHINNGWDLFVAEVDDDVRAMMAIKTADDHLDQLFVDPAFKGQGIGTRLLDVAKAKMPKGIWLRTAQSNEPAINFYKRHGFVHERNDVHPRLRYPVVYYRWKPA